MPLIWENCYKFLVLSFSTLAVPHRVIYIIQVISGNTEQSYSTIIASL